MDNLPDAWRTVGPFLPDLDIEDRRVLIVGSGSIGLYAVGFARALKAAVTYVDRDPRRAAIAAGWGATVYESTVEVPRDRYPVTVSTGGNPAGLRLRFVTSRVSARADLPAVLDLLSASGFDPAVVTATTATWADAAAAWSDHRDKLVITR